MSYKAERFNTPGYFNGFPFLLIPKEDWMLSPGVSGNICQLNTTVSHYWNLAAISCRFKIRTEAKPASYITGYAYDSESSPEAGQEMYMLYQVVNSYNEKEYPPQFRSAVEITGESELQTIDEDGLIVGSGKDYNSCYVHDGPDFLTPLTIQPENTGAFVITLDSGVAQYFEDLPEYGDYSKFVMQIAADYGTGIQHPIEKYPQQDRRVMTYYETGYIVPAEDWRFTVESGTMLGHYYEYDYPNPSEPSYGTVNPMNSHPIESYGGDGYGPPIYPPPPHGGPVYD